uniref:Uncharacterized protein n=1 Tax=Anguilla anguilla TaxID=7936 RepID=A0A0E9XUN7_ANGAN
MSSIRSVLHIPKMLCPRFYLHSVNHQSSDRSLLMTLP